MKRRPQLDSADLQQLFQYAVALCNDADDAQDLLHASVEQYLQELRQGKSVKSPVSFVRKMIRNRFIDQYRHRKRWPVESFEEQANYDISPLDLEQLHITQQALEHLWAELSPDERDVLYHWAVLGHTTDQACELLAIPRGTFLSRIHRLRKKFQLDAAEPVSHGRSSP